MASSTEQRIKDLAGEDEPTAGESVFKVMKRFCFKSVAWFGIYLLGYYGFSIAWLLTPLLLTVFRQQWKKERDFRLSAARQAALTNEKAMIESRIKIEDLPSWVFFPDKVNSYQLILSNEPKTFSIIDFLILFSKYFIIIICL